MYIYFTEGDNLGNARSNGCSSRMFIMELSPLIKVCVSGLCNPAVTLLTAFISANESHV